FVREAYGSESISEPQIKERFRRFKNSRTSMESDFYSGSPVMIETLKNVKYVRIAINKNHRL
ncbi:hypothetical protein EAI_04124, partial [Harpegnathos saltator]